MYMYICIYVYIPRRSSGSLVAILDCCHPRLLTKYLHGICLLLRTVLCCSFWQRICQSKEPPSVGRVFSMLEFDCGVDFCTTFRDHLYQLIKKRSTRIHSTTKIWNSGDPSCRGGFIELIYLHATGGEDQWCVASLQIWGGYD